MARKIKRIAYYYKIKLMTKKSSLLLRNQAYAYDEIKLMTTKLCLWLRNQAYDYDELKLYEIKRMTTTKLISMNSRLWLRRN